VVQVLDRVYVFAGQTASKAKSRTDAGCGQIGGVIRSVIHNRCGQLSDSGGRIAGVASFFQNADGRAFGGKKAHRYNVATAQNDIVQSRMSSVTKGRTDQGRCILLAAPTPVGKEESRVVSNFIRQIIDADNASGKHGGKVITFPPEPNGYPTSATPNRSA
jgi:hypothetical protein